MAGGRACPSKGDDKTRHVALGESPATQWIHSPALIHCTLALPERALVSIIQACIASKNVSGAAALTAVTLKYARSISCIVHLAFDNQKHVRINQYPLPARTTLKVLIRYSLPLLFQPLLKARPSQMTGCFLLPDVAFDLQTIASLLLPSAAQIVLIGSRLAPCAAGIGG